MLRQLPPQHARLAAAARALQINYQAILGCAAVAPHDKLAAGLIFLAITRRTSRRLNRGIDRLIPGDAR
jgi:hypothetical protein